MASGGNDGGQWVPFPCVGCSHRLWWSGDYWYCGNERCLYMNWVVSRDPSSQEWVQHPYTDAEAYDPEPYYPEDQHWYHAPSTEEQDWGAQTQTVPESDDVDTVQPGPSSDVDNTVYGEAQTHDYPPQSPSEALATVGSWPSVNHVESPTSAELSLANGCVDPDDEERRRYFSRLRQQEVPPFSNRRYSNGQYVVGMDREIIEFSPPNGHSHFYPSDVELSDDSDQGGRRSR